ncbi:hypothetical protein BSN82_12070 [Acinetobacter baylyi]|nr:hypothetical protein F952_02850 [Acinetobacter baylyi DSM 14961 = CIP 107474]KAF2371994.1 hypothetical protein BSL67_14300 [Acinetobacter baylyi]MAK31049.1 hypothetical protein [Acinetobacter sp.]KAF2372332.1 hypothetical protein BSL88_03910 [Acinetobacter baylyi]KAF2378285.1 hypothetical protein BSN81_04250 [Acinetobacter baylyi]
MLRKSVIIYRIKTIELMNSATIQQKSERFFYNESLKSLFIYEVQIRLQIDHASLTSAFSAKLF